MVRRQQPLPTGEVLSVRSYRGSELTQAMLEEIAKDRNKTPSAVTTELIREEWERGRVKG